MDHADEFWRAQFPSLYRESYVDYARARIQYTVSPVPVDYVSRLHLVALTPQGEVVVCGSEQGWRFLPGGTREPRETLNALARRELMEEAGAALRGEVKLFAAHIADSDNDRPYRPHLPHPRSYWAYATCPVELVAAPTNPADGEKVIEVHGLSIPAAAAYLQLDDPIHADVLRHADAMGLLPTRH